MVLPVTLEDIVAARTVLGDTVVRTPLVRSSVLSQMTGADVWLKLENLQETGAFKARGAGVRLAKLTDMERRAGVVAASAGNHAQGVAYHAKRLGIPATIFMPENTPFTKINRTAAYGAKVELVGEDLKGSFDAAIDRSKETGAPYIPPFDDPDIIAGQGTCGLEIVEELADVQDMIIPIGGGGLMAGCAIAAKAHNPDIRLTGAQSDLYPAVRALLSGMTASGSGLANHTAPATIADGIAVKKPGELTGAIIKDLVDDVLLADETELETAVQLLLETQRTMAEGSGAAGLAVLIAEPERFQERRVCVVISGGNIDARLLSSILMRGLVRAGRLARLRIEIPDQPGTLAKVSTIVGSAGGNIVEVSHQRLFHNVPVKQAELDLTLETQDERHVHRVIERLSENGYHARLLDGALF